MSKQLRELYQQQLERKSRLSNFSSSLLSSTPPDTIQPLSSNSIKNKSSKEVTFREPQHEFQPQKLNITESRSIRNGRQNQLQNFQSRSNSRSASRPKQEFIIAPPRKKNFVPEIHPVISDKVKNLLELQSLHSDNDSSFQRSLQSQSSITQFNTDRSGIHRQTQILTEDVGPYRSARAKIATLSLEKFEEDRRQLQALNKLTLLFNSMQIQAGFAILKQQDQRLGQVQQKIVKMNNRILKKKMIRIWRVKLKERHDELIKIRSAFEFRNCQQMLFMKMILAGIRRILKKENKLIAEFLRQKMVSKQKAIIQEWRYDTTVAKFTKKRSLSTLDKCWQKLLSQPAQEKCQIIEFRNYRTWQKTILALVRYKRQKVISRVQKFDMRRRWNRKLQIYALIQLRFNVMERRLKKTDFILNFAMRQEDQGQEAEFIPITVLSSDHNVVEGGPRRHIQIKGRQEEGTQDSRIQTTLSYTHQDFNMHNKQAITMYLSGGSLALKHPMDQFQQNH